MHETNTSVSLTWDLGRLRDALQDIYGDGDPGSVFLAYEWLEAAERWKKLEGNVGLLVVNSGARVVGVAPLAQVHAVYRGIAYRELQFLCIPDTQLCDIICANHMRTEALDAMASFLSRDYRDWDLLRLQNLPEESATPDILTAALARHRLRSSKEECARNYGLSLRGDWQSYYGRRSRRLKKGNNLIANRLKKNYSSVQVLHQHHELAQPRQLQGVLDAIEEVSHSSWKSSTGLTLENPGPSDFVRTLSEHAAKRGWLTIWQLVLDGEPVAFEYQLVYQGRVHALRADYRSDCEQYSPGSYLNWQILQALFSQDLEHYCMGPGSNAYKQRWSECEEPLLEFKAYAKSLKGRLLYVLREQLARWAKPDTRENTD
ncbi:MAG: GNAT family N-acetyltransferase [Gammaproteobacteria bacterium]|nr:GNAT family N-acetyltransferase [Gammaproteobacteria bacterium]